MILIDAAGLRMERPGRPLFDDLSVTVSSGDRLGVVGINGGGKSTLLQVLGGAREPEAGVVRRGRGVRVAALDQDRPLPAGTVADVVGGGWEGASVLDRLGMGGALDADVTTLSGGQAKRVALARALVEVGGPGGEPGEEDLLILDEPTNHLDLDAITWLEEWLARFPGGLVLVTHDRHVLDRVTTSVLELDRGRSYVHVGGYQSWLDSREERAGQSAVAEQRRRNLARAELAWLRRGAPARTRKPQARIEAATAIVEGRPEAPARRGDLPLHVDTPRLGDQVVELHGVSDGYGERTLFRGLDLALDPRERLGIVGPNGAGKSTLLDVLAGRRPPREGRVVHGSTVRVAVYDQKGMDLDPSTRVREAIAGPNRQPDWTDARLLEAFWFDDDAQWAPISLLSGGERRRVQLLLLLAQKPNVLLLDEPTNDLDLDTLRALEDFLDEWPGALVVVSHDRAFLERTVADVLVLDGQGFAGRRPGGYAAWDAERRATTGGRSAKSVTGSAPDAAPRPGRTSASKPGGGSSARTPSTLRRMLKDAEKELAKLDKQRATLEASVHEVAASGDHEALAQLGAQLSDLQAAVAEVEERWLALGEELEAR
ncbi:MAG: ABC-F family ATP-binding cassette domain-containing protein [Actinomycetota bacterium]|nr:ABC-F family ATP-binding cassette domain-containing protein [Actinomycetota bacterium]